VETELRFPVVCPLCARELLTEVSMGVVTRALSAGATIHLRASCHDIQWEATAVEVEQIREYLDAARVAAHERSQ
jgi:hypothetical protein